MLTLLVALTLQGRSDLNLKIGEGWSETRELAFHSDVDQIDLVTHEKLTYKVTGSMSGGYQIKISRTLVDTMMDGTKLTEPEGAKPVVTQEYWLLDGALMDGPFSQKALPDYRLERLLRPPLVVGVGWSVTVTAPATLRCPDLLFSGPPRAVDGFAAEIKETSGPKPIAGRATGTLDKETGIPESLTIRAVNVPMPGGEFTANLKATIRLVDRIKRIK